MLLCGLAIRLDILLTNRPRRRFEFEKSGEPLIRAHKETLSVAAMCVCNKDRSPA